MRLHLQPLPTVHGEDDDQQTQQTRQTTMSRLPVRIVAHGTIGITAVILEQALARNLAQLLLHTLVAIYVGAGVTQIATNPTGPHIKQMLWEWRCRRLAGKLTRAEHEGGPQQER